MMTRVHKTNGASSRWVGDEYSQFLVDQVAVMMEKEADFYLCFDYLKDLPVSPDSIDAGWRQSAAEWMFTVIDFYDLDRDIVNVGMSYVDQFFTISSLHHRWVKQHCTLVAMASLKLAIKLHEPRTLQTELFLKLGTKIGGYFPPQSVHDMEHEILWMLSWNVFPPTPYCIAHQMICMFPWKVPESLTRYITQELAKYLTELAVCLYHFVKFLPSRKSFACCLVAIDSLDEDCLFSNEARAMFEERIFHSFGLRHDDAEIRLLKTELSELLCENTDMKEFVALVRASNKSDCESKSRDMSPVAIKTFRFSSRTLRKVKAC
mmetsp:Transcript_32109/g.54788  ORF Transcript_32109/g.54788 Transcript_32109/m.54788 type:complete len:320 (+) Transcript_32109:258-1217(+)